MYDKTQWKSNNGEKVRKVLKLVVRRQKIHLETRKTVGFRASHANYQKKKPVVVKGKEGQILIRKHLD